MRRTTSGARMRSADVVWFKSKLDWWLGVVLVAVPLVQIVVLLGALRSGDGGGIVASLIGCAVVAGIYGLLVVPIRYGIAADALFVHFGVVRQRIGFDSIREVYPTHNPLSSAALSLDRLAIRTGAGPLGLTLISPDRRDEFIRLLSVRANLIWDGRRWTPGRDAQSG